MSISAGDIRVSVLLSLLLANIRVLSCFFFLLLLMFSNFLTIPVVKEKLSIKLALAIHTLLNEIIDTPQLVPVKAIKILSM